MTAPPPDTEKPPSLPRLLVRLLAAPLVLLVVVSVVLMAQVARMRKDSAWVDHTDLVIGAAHEVETQLLAEESSLRGYLLSGDSEFLEPYARTHLAEALDELHSLVADNPVQIARVTRIEERHEEWRAVSVGVKGDDDAAALARSPEELRRRKKLMDEARAEIAEVLAEEHRLRAERALRAARSVELTEVLVIGSFLGLGVLLLVVTRGQVARIVATFGGALDAERRARAVSEALVDNLERQESFRDTFLAMLGHDLRNPLTAVSMSASYALDQPGTTEKTRGLLRRIVSSADRIGRMVDQLIDLTRARFAETFPISLGHVDLAELVAKIVAEQREARPDVTFVLDQEGDLELLGDDVRLGQVLTNLLGNAAAHGRSGEVQVVLRDAGDKVSIRVRNDGEAIPAHVAAKLFDPFARGPEDKMRSDGLGLGLHISQRIVEAHDGTIRVRSDPETGVTELEVELPRQPLVRAQTSG